MSINKYVAIILENTSIGNRNFCLFHCALKITLSEISCCESFNILFNSIK